MLIKNKYMLGIYFQILNQLKYSKKIFILALFIYNQELFSSQYFIKNKTFF